MKDLLLEVQASAQSEYERAAAKFGPANNSHHESYAVILEEYEETMDDIEAFKVLLEYLWSSIKRNDPGCHIDSTLSQMREYAEHAAAEWIQVAAMCHKAAQRKTMEVW